MPLERIPMTQETYDKLAQELEGLKKHERQEVIAEIAAARSQGDLSENSEYHAAKEKQGYLEVRISEMEDKLGRAEIITASPSDSDHVIFGAVVRVKDLDTDKICEYKLVSSEEVDVSQGKISSASPIGKGLMGRKPGDVVEVRIPKGVLKLQVLGYH